MKPWSFPLTPLKPATKRVDHHTLIMSDITQQGELQFKSGEDSVYPIQFSVHERLSMPFVARITARSPKVDLALKNIVGFSAGLRVAAGAGMHVWTGVVRNMELVKASTYSADHSTFYLEIVPNFWLLSQRRGHRIFQHKSCEEIVTEILKEWDIEHEFRLRDKHDTYEYRVQYGESDLAFVSRLLEEDGITYFFDSASGKKQVTRVVFQERPRRSLTRRVNFHDAPPDVEVGPWVTKLHVGQASRTGKMTHIDFDFRRPDSELKADYQSTLSTEPEKTWEQYIYSPGGFLIDNAPAGGDTPRSRVTRASRGTSSQAGKTAVQRALEAAQFKRRFVDFESNVVDLSPADHIMVTGNPTHPRADVADKDLLIVETNTLGNHIGDVVLLGTAVFEGRPLSNSATHPQAGRRRRAERYRGGTAWRGDL